MAAIDGTQSRQWSEAKHKGLRDIPPNGTSMQIFLGSSREAVESGLLTKVAAWIEDAGHKALRWIDPEAFPAGSYTFATLRQLARQVDGAIFIFSEDDAVWYRTDKTTQPRDNVLIEYGLFSAALGEGRAIFLRSGKPRTAADLQGITYIDLPETGTARAEQKIISWLRRLETPEVGSLLLERLASPFQASGKQSLFLKGSELIRKARNQVALVAKTPIILVGPRPYDASNDPISYELDQFEAYQKLIARSSDGESPTFISVASLACVQEELRTYDDTAFSSHVLANYSQLLKQERKPRSKFRLRWYDGAAPMTFLVSDNDFMIWFKDNSGESVWITANNEIIARALHSHAESIARNLRRDHVLNALEPTSTDAKGT